jgi:hypothetical protein
LQRRARTHIGHRRGASHVAPSRTCETDNRRAAASPLEEAPMHGIIYLVGLIVVIMFILSLLGLR